MSVVEHCICSECEDITESASDPQLPSRQLRSRNLDRPAILPSAVIRRRQARTLAIQPVVSEPVSTDTHIYKFAPDEDSSEDEDVPSLGKIHTLFTFHRTEVTHFRHLLLS